MQRISITNPQNIIDGTAKKYYFKLRNTGGPKGDKGDKGDTGATGPQGPQGDPCTVVVNSTATLEPGSNAYVTNTGSLSNAVLDFGIPKGDKGDTGPQGQKGERGQQGEQGPIGPQGTPGQNATVYVGTTITTNPGTQARVYNTGTENNAVLNFEIPRGAKGDTGSQGPQGPQGPTGPAGQNFAPTIVAELPETGDSSKLYLTPKAHTTSTATGNPVTASVTEQAGAIESFQLDGDTFQQSYTGKNMIGFQTGNFSQDGLTFNFAADGTITIDGTRDTTSASNYNDSSLFNFIDGSFTFTIIPISGSFSGVNVGYRAHRTNIGQQMWYQAVSSAGNYNQPTLTKTAEEIEAVAGIQILIGSGTAVFDNFKFKLQVTAGSDHDTSYEPYVGGVPSPNPDYPQPIQTVTGEQAIRICGRNIYDKSKDLVGYALTGDGVETTLPLWHISDYIPVVGGETYIVTGMTTPGGSAKTCYYDSAKNLIEAVSQQTSPYTITPPSGSAYVRLSIHNNATTHIFDSDTLQIELGSTAHNYEAYSGTNYPLNLGSIELCKLGTYQDYIYKDGESWKVHKAISTITVDGSENWVYNGDNKFNAANISGMTMPINADALCYCATHIGVLSAENGATFTPLVADIPYATDVHKTVKTVRIKDIRFTEAQALQTWLSQNNTTIYYVVATATDTAITDTTLIAQLEAIRTASLENGTNTITNTATGSNLAGDMEIGYYGYNPTNRYDKWLWLDLNNNYEQIGS